MEIPEIIACLSGKGGTGKSTLARAIAAFLASNDVRVCLADFHCSQQTSIEWAKLRRKLRVLPEVPAELKVRGKDIIRRPYDVVVADGAPQGAPSSTSVALLADVVLIATSVSIDDLVPQRAFAEELVSYGVERERILFVLNFRQADVDLLDKARLFLGLAFEVAATSLPLSDRVVTAHAAGLALGEDPKLAPLMERLMREVSSLLATLDRLHQRSASGVFT